MTELRTLVSGLAMGESPRWHDGRLWFSDMGTKVVTAADLDGRTEVVAEVPGMPMGLGWLPDGTMLIVSSDGLLLRRDPAGALSTHADLTGLSRYPWSDMVVDGRGNAYIGNIGFDFGERDAQPAGTDPGTVALVTPDGTARIVADGTAFPNGMAITPDNATLILAESYANRLTAFDIDAGGGLSNRRVWADLGDGVPDGIWLGAEQAVWYADVPNQRCVLVREGGEVVRTVEADRGCFACVLGGPDGATLFVMAARWPDCMDPALRTGQVLAVDV